MKSGPIGSKIGSVERTSLADLVVKKLRHSIISGVLLPGTHLLETELAESMGVSRGALRESLRTLQTEGLVEAVPNRGSFVAMISLKDIEEIYNLRILLEGYAVRLVAENASDEEIAGLNELLTQTIEQAKKGDYQGANSLDFEWHKKLWLASGQTRLYQFLSSMESQIRLYLNIHTALFSELLDSLVLQHQDVMSAIAARDGELASQKMKEHIDEALLLLLDYTKKSPIQ